MKRSIIITTGIIAIAAGAVIVAVKLTRTSSRPDATGNPPASVITNNDVVSSEDVPANTTPDSANIPPTVSTPGLAKVVDQSLSVEERVHGLASGEITEVNNPQDLQALAEVLSDAKEDEVVRHEIASLRSGRAVPGRSRPFKSNGISPFFRA